jgi:hypothetical protein
MGLDIQWAFSMVAVIMGGVFAWVRIFAYKGVGLVQAIAAMYFSSFVVMEILRLVARKVEESELTSVTVGNPYFYRKVKDHKKTITLCAIAIQIVLGVIVLGLIVFKYDVRGVGSTSTRSYLFCLFIAGICIGSFWYVCAVILDCIVVCTRGDHATKEAEYRVYFAIPFALLNFAVILFYFLYLYNPEHTSKNPWTDTLE